jgi:hypothetical protein
MDKDVKAKWIAALKSGEYTQGRASLKQSDRYCCLGVLCDLFIKETKPDIGWLINGSYVYSFEGHSGDLPPSVIQWANLPSANPNVAKEAVPKRLMDKKITTHYGLSDSEVSALKNISLAELNDGGAFFSEIAEIISGMD